jgi:ribosomal protein S1
MKASLKTNTIKNSTSVLSPETSFSSYDLKKGDVGQGVVVCLKEFGSIVEFINKVQAIIPTVEITDSLEIGMVIKVRVLSVNPSDKKLKVTMKLEVIYILIVARKIYI